MDRGRFRSGHAHVLLPRSPRSHPFLYDVAMRSTPVAAAAYDKHDNRALLNATEKLGKLLPQHPFVAQPYASALALRQR